MRLKAHCFAENAEINPPVFKFNFKEWDVSIMTYPQKERNWLMLEISKKLTEEEIDKFKIKMEDTDDPESFFSKRSRPYQEILTEVAHLVEGLFSIFFINVPPKFKASTPVVNLIGEDEEEIKLLESESITRGFGYVGKINRDSKYPMDERIKDVIDKASLHLPAFSFFSQAIRSLKDDENELAFFLFFRIIDGYFSEGARDVENALVSKANEIEKFLPYTDNIKQSTQSILKEMNVSSKSHENYNGLLIDIVRIRHKLTHFSAKKASFHHSAKIKFELYEINKILYNSCFGLLRYKVSE